MQLLRAIAITAVCMGHVDPAGFSGPFRLFPPYSYQVAAFVFTAGYLYKAEHDTHPIRYIARKIIRLIIPLLLINCCYGFTAYGLHAWEIINYEPALNLDSLIIEPLLYSDTFVINGAMWFIAPLFIAESVNVLVRSPLSKLKNGAMPEIMLAMLYFSIGLLAADRGGAKGLEAGPELTICRVALFLSWFGMGRLYRCRLEHLDSLPNGKLFLGTMLGQLIIIYLANGVPVYNSAWCRFYNGAALSYASTILALAFMLRICRIIEPLVRQLPLMRSLANNSFSIMCHHQFGYLLVTLAYAGLFSLIGAPGDFDIGAMRSLAVGYFYLPGGNIQFIAPYVVAGIWFSLSVHRGWLLIRSSLSNWYNERKSMQTG